MDESGRGPVERLQSLIRTAQMSNVGIKRDLEGSAPDRLVADASLKNLKDKSKVQETYNRSSLAVHKGRDLLLQARTAGTTGRTVYERWFGAYTADRALIVRNNIKGLCNLFDSGVIILKDARSMPGFWGDCFGCTTSNSRSAEPSSGRTATPSRPATRSSSAAPRWRRRWRMPIRTCRTGRWAR